ncbi:MAG: class I SAM-dependent methyltransferase [Oligoflexia bacterium]|nr:class I SAM-dependent methyltransferase [Oligoflexia bacterium]
MAKKSGYLHGYSKKEQQRLYKQARFLEKYVYNGVNLKKNKNLIEVGCGVGAQTEILLEHFPKLKITCVDASFEQLKQAEKHLKKQIKKNKVDLSLQNAMQMDFKNNTFDSSFLCWFLEHVPNPVKVLKEVYRVMKKGGVIYCTEVKNSSFFVDPYSPTILNYWFHFNDVQWLMGGDPFSGAKLGNWLKSAGFKKIETKVVSLFLDSRDKKTRAAFLNEWTALMLSGVPALLKEKRITHRLVKELKREITILKKTKNSVFYFAFVQARAVK